MRKPIQMELDFEEPIEEEEDYPEYSDDFWKKKDREVITVTVDYSLKHLAELVNKKIVDLTPKFQRRYRWKEKRKSKLIESFMMGIPIPPIFLNEEQDGSYSVIDGRQRLIAISEFIRGDLTLSGLEVFRNFNGRTIHNIPSPYSSKLENLYTLRAVLVVRESSEHVMLEVFTRVNTGGVQLNPQEIRNATFQGSLNDMIMQVSESKKFHSLLRIRNRTQSSIWNQMKDAEFVLRYFTFKDKWERFPGPLKTNMDNYMKENQYLKRGKIRNLRQDFLKTIEVVRAFFGEYAFRRWDPKKGRWFGIVNSAIYDAQMFSCQHFDHNQAEGKREIILEQMKSLFANEKFYGYISRGTNTPDFFKNRIRLVREMLSTIVNGK